MKRRRFFVDWVKLSSRWALFEEGTFPSPKTKTFKTKSRAVAFARNYVKKLKPSQLIVKGRDGKIQTEFTYENDPVRFVG